MPAEAVAGCSNLQRSKSTTSVKERRKNPIPAEPLNPETSRVHALIAAHRAMNRSRQGSSEGLTRSDSTRSQRTARPQHIRFSPATGLRRHRSLLQSNASNHESDCEPYNRKSYFTEQSSSLRANFESTPENYGAEPSSFRRLRRAKSMLTPRRSIVGLSDVSVHTPFSQAPTLRHAASSTALVEPGFKVRLKRSLSFLRPASRVTTLPQISITDSGHHNEAVQLARDQFFREARQNAVKTKSSTMFHPRTRHQQKAFRRSLREAHLNLNQNLHSDCQVLVPREPDLKRRSVSASIRNGVRKVFGKSLINRTSIPLQQFDASRSYLEDDLDQSDYTTPFDDYNIDPPVSNSRDSFYVPVGTEQDAYEDLDKISQIIRSSRSRDSLRTTSRSRVTSWANSTATGSSAQRSTPFERNRLSIIKEDGGPHQPSSSAGRHLGGVNFNDLHQTQYVDETPGHSIDSQRIYSALMRRIGQEEEETRRAQVELAQIHENQNNEMQTMIQSSTIRAVSKTSSVNTSLPDDTYRLFGIDTSCDAEKLEIDSEKPQHRVNRNKQRLIEQESHSSFFPFSMHNKPGTPSPFRKFLQERRSQRTDDDTSNVDHSDNNSTIRRLVPEKMKFGGNRIGMSTTSVYSHTTNGGTNPEYTSPIGSSEELTIPNHNTADNIAAVIPSIVDEPGAGQLEITPPYPISNTDRTEWKDWLYGHVSHIQQSVNKGRTSHFREHAQIHSDDVEVTNSVYLKDLEQQASEGEKALSPTLSPMLQDSQSEDAKLSNPNHLSTAELRDMPINSAVAPKRSFSLTREPTTLLQKTSSIALNSNSRLSNENRKPSRGIRKISPASITRMLKEKKSQVITIKTNDSNKENRATTPGGSPPLNTPGRMRLKMKNGNGSGRLRKHASEMVLQPQKIEANTPTTGDKSWRSNSGSSEESPGDRVKQMLSARLSRPFNMDVPIQNRPFDSMYLGKREGGISDAFARLSVAPQGLSRGLKGYGGLGPSPLGTDGNKISVPVDATNESKSHSLWNSKRMVSNFLKSRRLGRSISRSSESAGEDTPAFL